MLSQTKYVLLSVVILFLQLSHGDINNNSLVTASLNETLEEAIRTGKEWISRQKDNEGGWGEDTHRMITALILAGEESFSQGTCESKTTVKQLELQLAVAIAKYHTSKLSSGQLSLYINALQALCKNPRDFYGIDLVSKLIHYHETVLIDPFVVALNALALCNSGVHLNIQTQEKLISIATNDNDTQHGIPDTRALAVIALSCAGTTEKTHYFSRHRGVRKAVKALKMSQNPVDGSFGNIYSSALVIQALTASQTDDQGWNKTQALKYILSQERSDGSFDNILAAYFALPVLAGKSLASLKDKNCSAAGSGSTTPHINNTTTVGPDQDPSVGKVVVDIVIYVDGRLHAFKNVRVAINTTLYEVLNSQFTCEWKQTSFGPMLLSLNGEAQDPATNKYWVFYQMEKAQGSDRATETALQTGAGSFYLVKDSEIVLRLQN